MAAIYRVKRVLPEASPYAYPPRFEAVGDCHSISVAQALAESVCESHPSNRWRHVYDRFPYGTDVYERITPEGQPDADELLATIELIDKGE